MIDPGSKIPFFTTNQTNESELLGSQRPKASIEQKGPSLRCWCDDSIGWRGFLIISWQYIFFVSKMSFLMVSFNVLLQTAQVQHEWQRSCNSQTGEVSWRTYLGWQELNISIMIQNNPWWVRLSSHTHHLAVNANNTNFLPWTGHGTII